MVNEVMKFIENYDPEVGKAIEQEAARQRRNLELIASENIVSEPVMMAMGTVLTNKYAEGYSGKRYYGGCQYIDVVETIAIERAKKLFGCEYANVQPHSGAQANMAVFLAMLKPGDTVLSMSLDHGGHLSHGSPVNFSGLYFNIVSYGVNDEGRTQQRNDGCGRNADLICLHYGRKDKGVLSFQEVYHSSNRGSCGWWRCLYIRPDLQFPGWKGYEDGSGVWNRGGGSEAYNSGRFQSGDPRGGGEAGRRGQLRKSAALKLL